MQLSLFYLINLNLEFDLKMKFQIVDVGITNFYIF